MNVVILTPEKEVFKGSATSVKVPGIGGAFEVLRNHAPVVSGLASGTVRVCQKVENVCCFTSTVVLWKY